MQNEINRGVVPTDVSKSEFSSGRLIVASNERFLKTLAAVYQGQIWKKLHYVFFSAAENFHISRTHLPPLDGCCVAAWRMHNRAEPNRAL
jgi:hypothetical protein